MFGIWDRPINTDIERSINNPNPQIYMCQVEAVNEEKGTAFCRCPLHGKTFEDVPICQPYMHPTSDEGIHFMPSIGSWSFVMVIDGQPYLMTNYFAPLDPRIGSYWGNAKGDAHQGDSWISTKWGNSLRILRGGMIDIFSNGLARSIYDQATQWLKHFLRRLTVQTDAGVEEYLSDKDKAWVRKEYTVKPNKPTLYRFRINKKEHVKFEVYDQAGEKFYGSFHWKKDGNIKITLDHDTDAEPDTMVEIETKGRLYYRCEEDDFIEIRGEEHNSDYDGGSRHAPGGPAWVARYGDGIMGVTEPASDGHTHEIKPEKVYIYDHSETVKTS